MSDTEQELACLHADALAVLFRVELKIGVCEQQVRAAAQVSKMQHDVTKRESQAAIFGSRSMKDRRVDAERIDAAASTPTHAQLKERELLAAVGKNPYERALLLAQMAPFQSEAHRRSAMLQEAMDCLGRAQVCRRT